MNSLVFRARIALLMGGTQAAVQLLGFASGLLVIRLLAPEQYAFYTIANAVLGAMTVMADGGIGSGVMAHGGRVWHDRLKLGVVLSTGLGLRRKLALVVAIVALPILLALLRRQGAGWMQALLVSAAVYPLFLASMTGSLLEAVPRLHQNLLLLQTTQIYANLSRAILLVVFVTLWPLAVVAVFAAALPQWWNNWRLRAIAQSGADWQVPPDPEVREQLLAQLQRTLPASAFYAFSGQLTVWMITLFGQASSVAAVGALSRLVMVLGILTTTFGLLAVPRFARLPVEDHTRIRRRYWQSQAVLCAACGVPVVALGCFPGFAVALLGPHYRGLEQEALLMALSGLAATLAGAAYSLAAARGIVAPPWKAIPISLALQLSLVLALPLDTIAGVIWLGLLSSAGQWILQVAYFERSHRGWAKG